VHGYKDQFVRDAISYALANLDDLNEAMDRAYAPHTVILEASQLEPVETLSMMDPDTDAPVKLCVFKDPSTGAMLGLEASHLEQDVSCGTYADPYNFGAVVLVAE
jgi:hypothetical protein